jgi:DNA-binding winged helix-turn-helix (wHTH) protein
MVKSLQRYRFADFILSPRRRVLSRAGRELPLIPRYFDLLVFLVEHRAEAVHRRDIFDRVWPDVVVSDSALSQAIRTLRRTLGDDSRDPIYIRTVSRHGYRFVSQVVEEEDDDRARDEDARSSSNAGGMKGEVRGSRPESSDDLDAIADRFEPLLQRVVTRASSPAEEEERRDAAERLHALGTAEALQRLGVRPGHARARALLRDTRWDVAGAGPVPLLHQPGAVSAAASLILLRLRRMARLAAGRAMWASIGGGVAGCLAGVLGGFVLVLAPGSQAPLPVAAVLGVVGGCCGAIGGAGVGAGLSATEAVARSQRVLWLVAGGAIGGATVGWATQWLGRSSLLTLVGVHVPVGGGVEGSMLGGAAGLGYALATRRAAGGLATPRGRDRRNTILVTGLACGMAALALTFGGRALVGGTIHAIAKASAGSQAVLTPIGRLIGDPGFGPLTRMVIGTGEGLLFGLGLALGLTRRPS